MFLCIDEKLRFLWPAFKFDLEAASSSSASYRRADPARETALIPGSFEE
jgi:hypothetical protein